MPEDKIEDIENYVKGLLMRLMNYECSTQEVREQIYQIAYSLNTGNLNVSQDIKSQALTFAESELRKQVVDSPSDARGFVFLGSLLSFLGNQKDSVQFLQKALSVRDIFNRKVVL